MTACGGHRRTCHPDPKPAQMKANKQMAPISLANLVEMAREISPNLFNGLDSFDDRDLVELGFDSMAMLRLFGAIEQRFDIDIFGMVGETGDYRTLRGLHGLCTRAAEAALQDE
jgi:hypothetical protein